jgi:hypothetical protein
MRIAILATTAKPAFILGLSPQDKKTVTTLRIIPTVRGTFRGSGIKMEHFDTLPDYWDSAVHNIRRRTERTRLCEVCHEEKKDLLTKETLIKDLSKANEGLVYTPRPIKKYEGRNLKKGSRGPTVRRTHFLPLP